MCELERTVAGMAGDAERRGCGNDRCRDDKIGNSRKQTLKCYYDVM